MIEIDLMQPVAGTTVNYSEIVIYAYNSKAKEEN